MKIGMNTDSLPDMKLSDVMALSARLGIDELEFCCGNWSNAPHVDLPKMLDNDKARREFKAKIKDHGIAISALNCSGNPLDPGERGKRHAQCTRDTIKLAGLMGIEKVVMMSGCPGAPGDKHANWITVEWPAELRDILTWQWDEVLIPYWKDLVKYAKNQGVKRLALELHGFQNVYNVATLQRLRNAVGPAVGANLDPSHLFWMGADPLIAARALGDAVYHVHAKDTRIDPLLGAINGTLETAPGAQYQTRSWNYITLGYGHGEQWWSSFCAALNAVGYDEVLSIEHEDRMMSPIEGVEKSVALLERVSVNRPRKRATN